MDEGREAMARRAREVLRIEAQAIEDKAGEAARRLPELAELILGIKGKVVVSGGGKSGIIGRKIAATLSSTGTPAIFLHPADALLGDAGLVRPEDLLLAVSNSGETAEVLRLAHLVRRLGVPVAALTGGAASSLAQLSRVVVDTAVAREACPLGLAPTASTTVTLALGDALAMILLERRGFRREDFAALHPGGSLGGRLEEEVRAVMRTGERLPLVDEKAPLAAAVEAMTARESIGVVLVAAADGKLAGVLTDGDLRRILRTAGAQAGAALARPAAEFMSRNPKTVEPEAKLSEALQIMEAHAITSLAVVDISSRPVGLVHLHDILGRGKIVF